MALSNLNIVKDENQFSFNSYLENNSLDLSPINISTLQINITKLCNQACLHCHVDSSPKRKESMDLETVDQCIKLLKEHPQITTLDLTGGAPELNPHFDYMVREVRKIGRHVSVRHNLTVISDGNPVTKESKAYLPEFFAEHQLEVISSLPYYEEYYTDKQRGRGVFEKSIDAIRLLNEQGYGQEGSGLTLNLVYNPVGAFLPGDQPPLEAKFKKELWDKFQLVFNDLFVITNMPIHRFKRQLKHLDGYDSYMRKLVNAFNPEAAKGIMCRNLVSVSYDGELFDCDFNQMLEMNITDEEEERMNVFNFDYDKLMQRRILFAPHCFGCTAGSGSSCGGTTT